MSRTEIFREPAPSKLGPNDRGHLSVRQHVPWLNSHHLLLPGNRWSSYNMQMRMTDNSAHTQKSHTTRHTDISGVNQVCQWPPRALNFRLHSSLDFFFRSFLHGAYSPRSCKELGKNDDQIPEKLKRCADICLPHRLGHLFLGADAITSELKISCFIFTIICSGMFCSNCF